MDVDTIGVTLSCVTHANKPHIRIAFDKTNGQRNRPMFIAIADSQPAPSEWEAAFEKAHAKMRKLGYFYEKLLGIASSRSELQYTKNGAALPSGIASPMTDPGLKDILYPKTDNAKVIESQHAIEVSTDGPNLVDVASGVSKEKTVVSDSHEKKDVETKEVCHETVEHTPCMDAEVPTSAVEDVNAMDVGEHDDQAMDVETSILMDAKADMYEPESLSWSTQANPETIDSREERGETDDFRPEKMVTNRTIRAKDLMKQKCQMNPQRRKTKHDQMHHIMKCASENGHLDATSAHEAISLFHRSLQPGLPPKFSGFRRTKIDGMPSNPFPSKMRRLENVVANI